MSPRGADGRPQDQLKATRRSPASKRQNKVVDVHPERPSLLQRLTGLRLGFCKESEMQPASSTEESLPSPEPLGAGQDRAGEAPHGAEEPQETGAPATQARGMPSAPTPQTDPSDSAAPGSSQDDASPPFLSQSLPQPLYLAGEPSAAVTLASGAKPPMLAGTMRQPSLQRPPLAVPSQSTATGAGLRLRANTAGSGAAVAGHLPVPPPLRARIESTCTAASRHRARAHESFTFSVDSLQMIVDDTAPPPPPPPHAPPGVPAHLDRRAASHDGTDGSWAESSASGPAVPMRFVDLSACQLVRDCSALPVDLDYNAPGGAPYSFDYSSSDDDRGPDEEDAEADAAAGLRAAGAMAGSGMGTAATGDAPSLVSSTSPLSLQQQQRDYSPTSVVKLDEEVPSWMLEWTGQQDQKESGGGGGGAVLLEPTEQVVPMSPPTPRGKAAAPTAPATAAWVEAAPIERRGSLSYAEPATTEPAYLVPGPDAGTEGVLLAAWMAACVADRFISPEPRVGYDDIVQVVVDQQGRLVGKQYDGHVLFRVDLAGKRVRSQLVSNAFGRALVIEEDRDDVGESSVACSLLPVSLHPELFLDERRRLVDEARFQKYRYTLAAPFEEEPLAEEDSEEKKTDDAAYESGSVVSDDDSTDGDKSDDPMELYKGFAPDEQQEAVLHMQFLLDTLCRYPQS